MTRTARSLALPVLLLALMVGSGLAQQNPCAQNPCSPKNPCAGAPGKKGKAQGQKTLVGVVTDSACGRKHTMMAGKPDAECTNECVKMGSKYALVVGKQVYTLNGQSEQLAKLAGQKAKITGNVDGDKVEVASVEPAKKG